MIGETIQKSLFEIPKPFSNNKLIPNLAVAFGITKTGLLKGKYGALENVFIGMRNLKISLEMLSIQNPAEILAEFFAAGHLKTRNLHSNPNIPLNFFELVDYMQSYSGKNGFACLENNFRKFFDIEQGIRLGILNQNIKKRFVESFLADYKSPFNFDFDDPNLYGEDKGVYADIIYKELKPLSERAKESPL